MVRRGWLSRSRLFGRLVVLVMVAGVLLAGASVAHGSARRTSPETAVRATVNRYLDGRYRSRVTLRAADRRATVRPTKDTAVAEVFDDLDTAIARRVGCGWANYAMRTRFLELDVAGSTAHVRVRVDVDYHYKKSPGIDSGVYGVDYDMRLHKTAAGWRIVAISGGDEDLKRFRKAVDARAHLGESVPVAARSLLRERVAGLPALVKEMSQRSASLAAVSANADVFIGEEPAASSRSYTGSTGSVYAQRFATAAKTSRFFYTADNNQDCTNFVSQCVWAAYGGYVIGNDAKTKTNIANKVRMVKDVWHAGTGGGTAKWEQVNQLWPYATSSNKTRGPMATGYNNNAKYTGIAPADVRVGNVLQVRQKSDVNYQHSVYVSIVVSGPREPASWDRIYVCQHSDEIKNRMASDLISKNGGDSVDPCYLRRMSFKSGVFDN